MRADGGDTALLDRLGPLGFGGAAIGNLYRAIPDEVAADTVRAAIEAGIGYVDTAPFYGLGLSEKRIGAVLAELDAHERVIVSTKVGRRLDPDPSADVEQVREGYLSPERFRPVFDYGYDAVMRSWEESRRRLRRERIAHPLRSRYRREGAWRGYASPLRRADGRRL